MQTVFSHVVQKRLSQENENVATTALAFILDTHESARNGMVRLLRGVVPELPRLWFRTQQTDGNSRPDMWGYNDEGKPYVFVENKFWAGLTDNQPVSYLRILAKNAYPTILLIVAPHAREQPLLRELKRKLNEAEISTTEQAAAAGALHSLATGIGPILVLTSWAKLLSFLELEVIDDKAAKSDLLQLRALCEEVESDSFAPFSAEQFSNQQTPAFVLQLMSIVQASVEKAVSEKVGDFRGVAKRWTTPYPGRYFRFSDFEHGPGIWLVIHFELWKAHGGIPLWALFSPTSFGRSHEVRPLLEPWAAKRGIFTTTYNNDTFALAIDIPFGEEKDTVIRAIVDRFRKIAEVVSVLKLKPEPTAIMENGQSISSSPEAQVPALEVENCE